MCASGRHHDHKLIVELDSWEFHGDRPAFESDRDRDLDTLLAGIETVRLTNDRMQNTPDNEAARLRQLLAARLRDGRVEGAV